MELAYNLFLTFLYVRSAAIVNTGQHDLSRENMCTDFCRPNNFDFARAMRSFRASDIGEGLASRLGYLVLLASRANIIFDDPNFWQNWQTGHYRTLDTRHTCGKRRRRLTFCNTTEPFLGRLRCKPCLPFLGIRSSPSQLLDFSVYQTRLLLTVVCRPSSQRLLLPARLVEVLSGLVQDLALAHRSRYLDQVLVDSEVLLELDLEVLEEVL
jgi:hypothetical protein